MHETLVLVVACVAGMLLGAVFFGGLWWTTREGIASPRPVLWFAGSLLVRMSIALAGFYLVARGHGERLLLCLAGFIMARLVVTWLTRPPVGRHTRPARETGHAH